MRPSVKISVAAALALIVALVLWRWPHRSVHSIEVPQGLPQSPAQPAATIAMVSNVTTNLPQSGQQTKLKRRLTEFANDEKAAFEKNFETRYKPAILKWASAFEGRISFDPNAVTADRLAERIGRNDAYHEYVFVMDGITLGVEDKKGVARVDYLNDPHKTRKLMQVEGANEPPITIIPVTKAEIITMLEKEGRRRFTPNEIRMTPSGFSGGLNGGAMVDVGGDPENGASWDYEMVFGPDGKLAYYLKGL